MQQFLIDDVGTTASTGQNVYDAYITQAPWLPAIQENLQDMAPWLTKSRGLLSLWNAMNPTSKQVPNCSRSYLSPRRSPRDSYTCNGRSFIPAGDPTTTLFFARWL